MVTAILHRFGAFLGTTYGFALTMASVAAGWWLFPSAYVAYLSVLAIVLPAVILVQNRSHDTAIHLKLDELIRAIEPADNSLRAVEKLPPEIIAAKAHDAELGG
jgi:low affinity Fe/Cu permease